MEYKENDKVTCYNIKPLEGNDVKPPLGEDKEYEVKSIIVCECGKQHLDVGLKSKYNWISCHSCKEELKNG